MVETSPCWAEWNPRFGKPSLQARRAPACAPVRRPSGLAQVSAGPRLRLTSCVHHSCTIPARHRKTDRPLARERALPAAAEMPCSDSNKRSKPDRRFCCGQQLLVLLSNTVHWRFKVTPPTKSPVCVHGFGCCSPYTACAAGVALTLSAG